MVFPVPCYPPLAPVSLPLASDYLIQPAVYRTIIDDVIHQVRPEFEQIGVEEAVLQELLRLWELKLAQSRVADFSSDERMGTVAKQFPPLTLEQVQSNQQLLQQQSTNDKSKSVSGWEY
jgi:transcription initiation factor TFIIA large subunit